MNNPDFSTSPEHVALAKAIGAVYSPRDKWEDFTPHMKGQLLMFADAAITHLGSGYVLPPATEANAERLARNVHALDYPGLSWDTVPSHKYDLSRAMRYLRALHAMVDAEKPEPVFLTPQQADEMEEAARIAADPTYCRPGCEKDFGHPGQHSDEDAASYNDILDSEARIGVPDEPKRDAYADGQRRRERQKLVWDAAISVWADADTGHEVEACMDDAVLLTDAYLAWRDADEAVAKERICKK